MEEFPFLSSQVKQPILLKSTKEASQVAGKALKAELNRLSSGAKLILTLTAHQLTMLVHKATLRDPVSDRSRLRGMLFQVMTCVF